MKFIPTLAFGLALAGLASCTTPKPAAWSAEDRDAVAHVLAKTKANGVVGQGITLDLSDPKSARFLKRHFEASGVTADRYPGFHQQIAEQSKLMATNGVTLPKTTAVSEDLVYQDIMTNMLALYQTAPQAYTAAAAATMEASALDPNESLQLAKTSLCFYDSNRVPIPGSCVVSQSFGAGQYFPVQASANTSLEDFTAIFAATYWDVNRNTYIVQAAQLGSDSISSPQQQTITNPLILNPGNKPLQAALVCTNRQTGISWGQGGACDYGFLENNPQVLVGVTGSVTYTPAQTPQLGSNNKPVGSGIVTLTNTSTGGGCSMGPAWSGQNFFNRPEVTYKQSNKTLSWGFTSLDFGAATGLICGANSTSIVFNILVSVTDSTTNQPVVASQMSVAGTVVPGPISGNIGALATPMLRLVAGCLHPDTMIAMAGKGDERAIKAFTGEGERVRSAGGANQVVGTVNGTEKGVLYEVKAANGLTVKASEFHPFVMENGTYRAAKDLKPGDRVATARGVAALAGVTRIPYQGAVHNLVLAHPAHATVTPATESFFANGFLVGGHDAQQQVAQAKLGDPARVRALLPKSFHKDYDSHLEDRRRRRG